MAARRTHGKKRKLTPRGIHVPQRMSMRARGGQPGNDNAWKHGRYTRELIALRKDVSHHLREVYAYLAGLGFEPRQRRWARAQKARQEQRQKQPSCAYPHNSRAALAAAATAITITC